MAPWGTRYRVVGVKRHEPNPRASVLLATLLLAVACGGNPPPRVDLGPARAALASARAAGAQGRAEAELKSAEASLAEAEALLERGDGTRVSRAEMLAATAAVQARLAEALSKATQSATAARAAGSARDSAALRRLEEQIALLTQELQMADSEIMRSRGKGIDTKAEASSAIAEARVLMGRGGEGRARATVLARCRQLLADAETRLLQESFGAARWQALKCQGLLEAERRPTDARPANGSDR